MAQNRPFARLLLVVGVGIGLCAGPARGQDPAPAETIESLERRVVEALGAGDPRRAAELAARQLALREQAGEGPSLGLASTLSYLALAHRNLDEFAVASGHARRALAITIEVKGADALDTATALNNLAGILRERGDAVAAERALRRALEIRSSVLDDDHPALAQSYNNLASLRLQQGDAATAQELYAEALRIVELRQGAEHDNALKARQNLARALAERGRPDDARAQLDHVEAALRARTPVVASRLADVLAQRARLDASADRLDAAERGLREAITLRRSVGDTDQVEIVRAQLDLARVQLRRGAIETAIDLLDPCITDAIDLVGESHPLTLEARAIRADAALARDDASTAIAVLEPATTAYLRARRRAAEGLRSATAPIVSPFERLALAFARQGDLERAWEAADRARGRLLDAPADTVVRPVLARLRAALDPRTAAVGWIEIEDADVALGRAVWVVRADRPVQWIALPESSPAAARLRETVSTPPDLFAPVDLAPLHALGAEVYHEHVAPVRAALDGIDHLLLVPDGVLLGLPFAVLVDDDGRHLDESYVIEWTPAMRTWLDAASSQRRRDGTPSILALGDPPFRPEHLAPITTPSPRRPRAVLDLERLPRLPGTRAEAEAARAHFARGTLLLGADASEAQLRTLARTHRLRDFDVVHLATHALVDVERPGGSLLALSRIDLPDPSRSLVDEGPLDDGALTVDEILAEWNLDADLVVLSACNTGGGRRTAGEGLLGFAQAFLMVGARSTILTQWEVDDEATALLMERFYAVSSDGDRIVPPAQALRAAQRWLRESTNARGERPYAHPWFWAPHVVVGVR